MRKIYLSLMMLVLGSLGYGYINLHPSTFDKNITSEGTYHEFELYNPTKKSLRYAVNFLDSKNNRMDMTDWITFYPNVVEVKPGEIANIKLMITSPEKAKEGHYFSTMNVKQLKSASRSKEENATVDMLLDINIGLHGYVGENDTNLGLRGAKLTDVDTGLRVEGVVENSGLWGPRVNLVVRKKDGIKNEQSLGRIENGKELKFDFILDEIKKEEIQEIEIVSEIEKKSLLKKEFL